MEQQILAKLLMIPAVLIGFTIHEFAHAYTSDKLGDKTPKFDGRLTLNPFVHIDILGFIMIILVQFGWAKPVRTNPTAYKNYYRDDMKVSLAGPFSNLLIAVIFALIIGATSTFGTFNLGDSTSMAYIISEILYYIVYINIILFVLNILPIPGFDGFHALCDMFPSKLGQVRYNLGQYQTIILIIFLISPLSSYLIGTPSRFILNGLFKIVFTIF